MPDLTAFSVPIEPFASIAASPIVLVILGAWGIGEALVFPIVPDVLVGLLVLAAPWRLAPLLGAAILGGAAGALVGWWLRRHRPLVFERVLRAQPGLGEPGLAEAEARLRGRGPLGGFAQVGPGLPLKAYIHALAVIAPATLPATVVGLALVNRLTRLGPAAVGFAALHPWAIGWSPVWLAVVWVGGWAVFYIAYWIAREPRRDN